MIKNNKLKIAIITGLTLLLGVLVFNVIRDLKRPTLIGNNNDKQVTPLKRKIKIGFSLGTLKEERWVKDRDILMAKAREMDAEIIVQNANNDDQDQLKQVKYLLEQGIDVLIIVPNDYYKSADAVDLAKRQGIPVISYDRLVLDADVDLYITFDNVKVGELMGSALLEKIKHGNLLIINGAKNDNNTTMIKEGYDKILIPYVSGGKINIVGEEWAPNWLKEYAFTVVDKAVQKDTKINAIIAGNDSLAEGAIEALSEHRLTDKVIVIGQDADLGACQRIVEGTQFMTIYKPIEKLAEKAVEMAVKLVERKPLNTSETIYNGKYMVPYYVLEPIAVKKNNIDITIIRDGFHLKDDVYRK
ncbi:sugar ABC transporter substrate-binding protein [Clostridium sp.]|uniref:sugar ABC transporter substrate-binding protein n=1 Tax=Clostridium sp. TaxID=1506 RepID=UPI003D6D8413